MESLLDAVESKPGTLPLLQFALREMWGRQENRIITRRSYDDIGGVEGALARRPDEVFGELTKNGADTETVTAFQRLFTRLVMPGEGQEDTRRVVDREELGDDAWSLAQNLAGEANRLVVTNAPTTSHETAEVVHEALIRYWPKLVEWIDRDRDFQSWLRRIRQNVEAWSADPADEGILLRGGPLAISEDWLARRREDLNPAERSYIEASIMAADMRQQQARRAAMRTRFAAAVFMILFIAASILTVVLFNTLNERGELLAAAVNAEQESVEQKARAENAAAHAEEAAQESSRQKAVAQENSNRASELQKRAEKQASMSQV